MSAAAKPVAVAQRSRRDREPLAPEIKRIIEAMVADIIAEEEGQQAPCLPGAAARQ